MSEALNNLRQQITYCERLCEIADYDEITSAVQMGAILQTMRKAQYELAAALGREKLLRAYVELYANEDNWGCSAIMSRDHDCESEPEECWLDEWQGPTGVHGFELAQECLKTVEAMK